MRHTSFADMNCSLAQTLEVVGERWTLLILRDAFYGLSRFEEFRQSLGIARNILSDRLRHLVAAGILEKVPLHEGAGRYSYLLSERGRDLQPVLLALVQWGDRWRPHPKGTRVEFIDRESRMPVQRLSLRAADGRILAPEDIRVRAGPGLGSGQMVGRLRLS